ncbi:MAG: ANTAR domain-containing protein [Pseudomonadota bacterium]
MKVVLVDAQQERAEAVTRVLQTAGRWPVVHLESIEGLLAVVNRHEPEVLVVNLQSVTKTALEYLATLNRHYPLPVVIFADDMDSSVIASVVDAGVAAYVVDGLQNHRINLVIDIAVARFRKYRLLEEELMATKNLLSERKVIERAKGILMKQHGYSEDDAYHALRRQAMRKNKKLVEVAEGLVSAAELMG